MGIIHKAYRTIKGVRFDFVYHGGIYIHVSVNGHDVTVIGRQEGWHDRTEFRNAVVKFARGREPRDIMNHVLPYLK